ncbi:MAG: hypothetical protein HY298_05220 [Verrucomicrobia bacterium]|nr:hypothetical protein [Verrucomicrobiota bacterium]
MRTKWPRGQHRFIHLPISTPPAEKFHNGKFNYLFVDSHVELLKPSKTTPDLGLRRGMWSIKTGD